MNNEKQSFAKLFSKSLLALAIGSVLYQNVALANPLDGKVVSGSANIVQKPSGQLDIIQNSHKAVIDWRGFSIAKGEHTRFSQPSSSAIALNRVRGGQVSSINGSLTANGNVWLINPNGVLFGKSAQINVGSLMATTSDIDNEDFIDGRYSFNKATKNIEASIVNQGQIEVTEGGSIVLAAHRVNNEGSIKARLGHVVLASGDTFTIDFHGDGLLQFDIGEPVQQSSTNDNSEALLSNSGKIIVDGGIVEMTAQTRNSMVEKVINMEGVIQAKAVDVKGGTIILSGGKEGIVAVSGTLDVSGKESGQVGGVAKVLGEKVGLFNDAKIDASGDAGGGEVLVGGNFQGKGSEPNSNSTFVAENATIKADALSEGDGGKVIVWADETADIHGELTAKGGVDLGNGGVVETSGGKFLNLTSIANVSARKGTGGTWLIDPTNITIVAVGGEIGTNSIGADIINSALNLGSSVTLDTSNTVGPNGQGNITQLAGALINKTGGGEATLTLSAENNIELNAGINSFISSNGRNLNIEFSSGGGIESTGAAVILGRDVSMTANDSITLNGPDAMSNSVVGRSITLNTPSTLSVLGTLNARRDDLENAGDVTIGNTLVPTSITVGRISTRNLGEEGAGGDINITTTGLLDVTGAFKRDGGIVDNPNDPGNDPTDIASISSESSGDGGEINIVANGGISTVGGVFSNSKTSGNGGALTLTSNNGPVNIGFLDSSSKVGNAGSIELSAVSNLTTLGIDSSTTGNGIGGNISAATTNGTFSSTNQEINAGTGNVIIAAKETNESFTANLDLNVDIIGNSILLIAGDAINQTSGEIVTSILGIEAENQPTLLTSDIDILAANITGADNGLIFNDANSFEVGRVDSLNGISTFNGDVTLRAGGDLAVNSDINTRGGKITINSDRDKNNSGRISISSGVSIASSGGDIILGGGLDPLNNSAVGTVNNVARVTAIPTDNATGVTIENATLASGNGNIIINGKGADDQSTAYGILIKGDNARIESLSGNIDLKGIGGAGAVNNSSGILLTDNTLITTIDGALNIDGKGRGSGNLSENRPGRNNGIDLDNSATIAATGAGTVTVTGRHTGNGLSTNDGNSGILLGDFGTDFNPAITSNTGSIQLLGQTNSIGFPSIGVSIQANSMVNSTGGDINITGNSDISLGIRTVNDGRIINQGLTSFDAGNNDIQIETAGNDFGSVSIINASNVTLKDVNSIELVDTDVSGDLNIIAGGAITQMGTLAVGANSRFVIDNNDPQIAVAADILLDTEANNLAGSISFETGIDDSIGTLGIRNINSNATLGKLPTTDLTNLAIIFDNTGISLPSVAVTSDLSILAGGAITQTGSITATNFVGLNAKGNINLTADVTGNSVLLQADNTINQTAGTINSTQLGIKANTQPILTTADIAILAAKITGSGNGFNFTDTNDFTVGKVGSLVGVTTTNGDITLNATGILGLTANVSGNSVLLKAGNTITQSAGTILAKQLGIEAISQPELTTNDIDILAANITGAGNGFSFSDTNDFIVGTVGALTGVTTNNGDVVLSAVGNLNVVADVTGSSVSLQAGNTISFSANIDTGSQTNGTINIDSDGTIESNGSGIIQGRDINIMANGAITLKGRNENRQSILGHSITINTPESLVLEAIAARNDGPAKAGNVTIGNILIPSSITLGRVSTRNKDGGSGGNINITTTGQFQATDFFSRTTGFPSNDPDPLSNPDSASIATEADADAGNINIVANGGISTVAGIFTNSTTLGNGGSLTLASSNGAIKTGILDSSSISGDGGAIIVSGTGNLNLNSITSAIEGTVNGGKITIESKNASLAISEPIKAGSGDIGLSSADTLSLRADLTGNSILLQSGNTINQASGTILTKQLGIEAISQPDLTSSNDIDILAANITGDGSSFFFSDTNSFVVGTVGSLNGISTLNGDVTLRADGDLAVNSDINTRGGKVTLNSDRDEDNSGRISINSGVSISSSGGDIILGGGLNPLNTPAVGTVNKAAGVTAIPTDNATGVTIENATLASGDGNIIINGKGADDQSSAYGILIKGDNARIESLSGNIDLKGIGGAGAVNDSSGILLTDNTLITTLDGAINFDGEGRGIGNLSENRPGRNNGIDLENSATIVATGTGKIAVTGRHTGNGLSTNDGNSGILLGDFGTDFNPAIISNTGSIQLLGETNGNGFPSIGVSIQANSIVNSTGSGDINITGNSDISLGITTVNDGRIINQGLTSFDAGDNDIQIETAGNDFGSVSIINAANATIIDANAIEFDKSQVTGDLNITARGFISQTGSITATNLGINNVVGITNLSNQNNNVNTLAVNVGNNSDFTYLDIDDLIIGQIGALNGIISKDGDVSISTQNGDLTVNNAISIGFGNLDLKSADTLKLAANVLSDSVLLQAGNTINQSDGIINASKLGIIAVSQPTLTTSDIDILAADITGQDNGFSFTDANDFKVGKVGPSLAGIKTTNGNVVLDAAGNLDLAANITGGSVLLQTGSSINQTAGTIINATQLGIKANSQPTLSTADIDVLAADITGPGNGFSFSDINNFEVGNVGSLTGIKTINGNVVLDAAGNLDLAANVAGESVLLQAGNSIIQTNGSILAKKLGIKAASQQGLTFGDIDLLAAKITGVGNQFSFSDANSFTLGTIGSISGISTENGDVSLQAADSITIEENITTNGGNLSLAGRTILASNTTINSNGGAIDFNNLVNGNSELTLEAGNGNITFHNDVGTETALGPVAINSANNVSVNGKFVAAETKVKHSGNFTTSSDGFLNVTSLSINPDANSANLKGIVSGAADRETSLTVEGPVDDPDFIINDCVIGVKCINEQLITEVEPRPSGETITDSAFEAIDEAGPPKVIIEMQQRRPSNNPAGYQYSNFGNTELWDNVPGAYSISSFAAFTPVNKKKDEVNIEEEQVE